MMEREKLRKCSGAMNSGPRDPVQLHPHGPGRHRLSPFARDVFIDVDELVASSAR